MERELRAPEEVAIVGYDDIVFAASTSLALTSVRQPAYAIGRSGMELLLEEIAAESTGAHRHHNVLFKPELVVRPSTAAQRG